MRVYLSIIIITTMAVFTPACYAFSNNWYPGPEPKYPSNAQVYRAPTTPHVAPPPAHVYSVTSARSCLEIKVIPDAFRCSDMPPIRNDGIKVLIRNSCGEDIHAVICLLLQGKDHWECSDEKWMYPSGSSRLWAFVCDAEPYPNGQYMFNYNACVVNGDKGHDQACTKWLGPLLKIQKRSTTPYARD